MKASFEAVSAVWTWMQTGLGNTTLGMSAAYLGDSCNQGRVQGVCPCARTLRLGRRRLVGVHPSAVTTPSLHVTALQVWAPATTVAVRSNCGSAAQRSSACCAASASGNAPGSPPALARIVTFVNQQSLPLGLCLAVLLGAVFPQPAVAMSKIKLTQVSTFIIFIISGVRPVREDECWSSRPSFYLQVAAHADPVGLCSR
jgi:hypothetical protein